jgi:cobalamin biosynthesis protein CobW
VRSRGALEPKVLIGLQAEAETDIASRLGHHGEEEEHDHDDFESIVVTPSSTATVDGLRQQVATALALDGVLRVKGFARVKDRPAPVVVQAVGGRVELSFARPDAAVGEHLVVIGLKGFDGDTARRTLQG